MLGHFSLCLLLNSLICGLCSTCPFSLTITSQTWLYLSLAIFFNAYTKHIFERWDNVTELIWFGQQSWHIHPTWSMNKIHLQFHPQNIIHRTITLTLVFKILKRLHSLSWNHLCYQELNGIPILLEPSTEIIQNCSCIYSLCHYSSFLEFSTKTNTFGFPRNCMHMLN